MMWLAKRSIGWPSKWSIGRCSLTYAKFRDEILAIAPERYPAAYIDRQVVRGVWRVWSEGNSAIVAEIKTYPSGLKEVHGIAAVGEPEGIIALIPLAEAWGRKQGCAIAAIESRPAWAKLLPGYEIEQVRIVKELSYGDV